MAILAGFFLPTFGVVASFPPAFWRWNVPCGHSSKEVAMLWHSDHLAALGAQFSDGLEKSHDFVVYLGCLHNEDGSDTSGGISMFTSTFKVEVELPKYMKSDVTWGHSGT